VHDKPELRLHRPARQNRDRALDCLVVVAGGGEQVGDRLGRERMVDDDAERAVLVVLQDQDDGVIKT
jgi:hypothetical protein